MEDPWIDKVSHMTCTLPEDDDVSITNLLHLNDITVPRLLASGWDLLCDG